MLCPKCNAEIEKGKLTCGVCGAQVLPLRPSLDTNPEPERRITPDRRVDRTPLPKTQPERRIQPDRRGETAGTPTPPQHTATIDTNEILDQLQSKAQAEKRERVHEERLKAMNATSTEPKEVPKGVWVGVGILAAAAFITLIIVAIRFNGGSFNMALLKEGKFPLTFDKTGNHVENEYDGDTSWLHANDKEEEADDSEADQDGQQPENADNNADAGRLNESDFYEEGMLVDATSEIEQLFAGNSSAQITEMASNRWSVEERGDWFASGETFPESIDGNIFEMTAGELALYSGIHFQNSEPLDTEGYMLYHFPTTQTIKKGFYIGSESYIITDRMGKVCVVDLEYNTDGDIAQDEMISHDEKMRDALERTAFLINEYKDYESTPIVSDSHWSGTLYDAYVDDGNYVLIGKSWLSGDADPCREEFKSQLDDFDDFIAKETEENTFPKWGINIDGEYMATLEEKIARLETLDYYEKIDYSGFTYYSLEGIPVYIIVRPGFNGWNASREYIGSAIYYAEAPSPDGNSTCEYFFADNLYRMVDSEGNNYDYNCPGWKKYNDMGKKLIEDRAAIETAIRNDGVLPQVIDDVEEETDGPRDEFRARRKNLANANHPSADAHDSNANSDTNAAADAGTNASTDANSNSNTTPASNASDAGGYTGHTEIMELQ